MGMDFLSGALSGGIMSGSNVAINGANVQTETLVSDEAANKLLNDRTSVAFLEKHGNLNLQKGMTQEKKRAAVRQAVESAVHKEKGTAKEEIANRKEREESEIGEIFRRTVKGFAEGGKVVTFKNLPQKYQDEFLTGLEFAESHVKNILMEACDTVDYVLGQADRSYYRRGTGDGRGTIYLGRNSTASTIAHELFHQVDVGHKISKTLSKGLTKDYETLYMVSSGSIKEYLIKKYPEAFRMSHRGVAVMCSKYRGIADILNGLSKGQVSYGYRHTQKYWEREGALEAEAWAQLGRILFENDLQVLEMLQNIFPNLLSDGMKAMERRK